ncbi:MAG: prepilin-type N-terminal cleavage/methylation domain-containing protein [Oscillospiraceae bacterium]
MVSNCIFNLKSKKGTSLVEIIVAVFILAIVVASVLSAIAFSQRTVVSRSQGNKAAAQAQSIADILISELNNSDLVTVQSKIIDGAEYVDETNFPDATKPKQFTIIEVDNSTDNVSGYKIKTAVSFSINSQTEYSQMTAFTAKEG